MLLERIDLQRKLTCLRKKEMQEQALLEEVEKILKENVDKEAEILQRISEGDPDDVHGNNFNFDLLESGRIFHLSQIKKICIKYRLRFLSTKYFKGELPPEAISAVRELEEIHEQKLQGFKIVAPAKYLDLKMQMIPFFLHP